MKKTVIKIMTALILGIVTMQFLPLTALGAINLDAYINRIKEINAEHFRKSRYTYSFQLDNRGKQEKLRKLNDAYAKLVYGTGKFLLGPLKLESVIYNRTYSEIPHKNGSFNNSSGNIILKNATSSSLLNNSALNNSTRSSLLNNSSGSLLQIAPLKIAPLCL
jgi:hypothetical protein